jgi:23S rRNA pseudouridine2605 synthase
MEERLQKYLAHAGVASRRQAERLMLEGRIRVNGQVADQLGMRVDPEKDSVKVDGKMVRGERQVYVLLNKPKNTICTMDDPAGRMKVTDLVHGLGERIYPVGRLDYDTTGVLLLTNDGELTNLLTHPKHHVPRTYVARVKGVPTEAQLDKMRRGLFVDGRRTSPALVKLLATKEKNSLVQIILHEGRHRQVKLMCLAIGHPCQKLVRTHFGFLTVDDLQPGQWRRLEPQEVKRLLTLARKGAEGPKGSRRAEGRPRAGRVRAENRETTGGGIEAENV